MEKQTLSLINYFGDTKLKKYAIKWICSYSPYLDDYRLCLTFNKIFSENPELFDINGHSKYIIEDLIDRYYHNEAYVKSEFVKFLKKEKKIIFFEYPVNGSRADICSINNNCSFAYEIKTVFDTTNRLKKQINDYLKVFEYVYVICHKTMLKKILDCVPKYIGVYTYEDSFKKCKFNIYRYAKKSSRLNEDVQFKLIKDKMISNQYKDNEFINTKFKYYLSNKYKNKWLMFSKKINEICKMDYQYYFNSL